MNHTLLRHDEPLAVVRLGPGADVPDWATAGSLLSVTATAAETSLVCNAGPVPRKSRHEGPFVAFSVAGPLDFALTGVLSAILEPLAAEQIPVFTLSTFDTDWVLVPAAEADRSVEAWLRVGLTVRSAHDTTDDQTASEEPT